MSKQNTERKKITSKAEFGFHIGEHTITGYYSTAINDNSIYIDVESVKDIVKSSIDAVQIIDVEYLTKDNELINHAKAYSLYDFIEHLKPEPLKYIARYGLKHMSEDLFLDDYIDDIPKPERNLSEFDNAIIKAMKYNPKDERERK